MKHWKMATLIFGILATGSLFINSSAFGQAKPIDLFYSNVYPAPHKMCVSAVEWGKEIEKRTNGRVKVTMFPGGTLTPGDKCYDGVVKGLSHVGMSVFSYTVGKFPLMEVIDLPLGYKSGAVATTVTNEFYANFKPKELDEVKVMFLMGIAPSKIHTKRQSVGRIFSA